MRVFSNHERGRMMIQIGLTGWGDHPDIYHPYSTAKEKLMDYSSHFPIVELDSTFYAIQPERNIRKWIDETPDNFPIYRQSISRDDWTSSRRTSFCIGR